MKQLSRRKFLKTIACGAFFPLLGKTIETKSAFEWTGSDLSGWDISPGDGGTGNTTADDIQTNHYSTYSEVLANIKPDPNKAAHNITVKKVIGLNAMNYIHTCEYDFRLPYLPSTSNETLNGQTIEGGIQIWDGENSRMKYEVLFQWIVNPFWKFGTIFAWTGTNGNYWVEVGELAIDTEWHRLKVTIDLIHDSSSMKIDDTVYPSSIGISPGDVGWGNTVDANFQAEAISIDPGSNSGGKLHKAQFRNWRWFWDLPSMNRVFIPLVSK